MSAELMQYWSKQGAHWWGQAQPIPVTLGETFLRSLGISLLPGPDVARFHPSVDHPKLKRSFPALIFRVAGSAEPSFHFIFLAPDGKGMARIEKKEQKRTLGSSKGGLVHLAAPIPSTPHLAGEGILTALAAMQATGLSGSATLGTSGLVEAEWRHDVHELILLAENDENHRSQKALEKACPELINKGLKIRVATPPVGFNDFANVVDPNHEGGGQSGFVIIKMIIESAPEWKPKRRSGTKPGGKGPSQASFIVDAAVSRCNLFCDPHGELYASFVAPDDAGEHRETHKLKSKSFSLWLRLLYYAEKGGAPSSEAIRTAVNTLEAKAHFDRDQRKVYLRTAAVDGRIYLDMCNDRWQVIEIDSNGYRVLDDQPVHFRRERSMLPLPAPTPNIDPKNGIARLSEVLHVRDARDLIIIGAFELSVLAARAPYVIVVFDGEPGSTKSSAAYAVRSIVDPNASPLRTKPKEPHNVFVAATHSAIVVFNNLSSLPDWLSDVLCVVSEGSGDSRRELYTDVDENLIFACAPFILTAIENVVVRGDCAQRALFVHLAPMPSDKRMTEDDFKKKFRQAHPDILAALCSAAAVGLRVEKTLDLTALPRLASFYRWAAACEVALWGKGEFQRAFAANATDAVEDVIDNEPAAATLLRFIAKEMNWEGTATQLLSALVSFIRRPLLEAEAWKDRVFKEREKEDPERERAVERVREAREAVREALKRPWPKRPNGLVGRLKRASGALLSAGVQIEWQTRHGDAKIIKIKAVARQRCGDGLQTEGTTAKRSSSDISSPNKRLNSQGNQPAKTGRDGRDEDSPPMRDSYI